MKQFVRFIALVLVLVFAVTALASCNRGGETNTSTAPETADPHGSDSTGGGDSTTATATTVDKKWSSVAREVKKLADTDRTLKIEISINKWPEHQSRNDEYMRGPDEAEVAEAPLIQQMVYERNRAASELLGTTVEYITWDDGWGKQASKIKTIVQGNAADAPDLFVNMLSEINQALREGVFRDVWSINNTFFDFTAEGWLDTWMTNLSFSGDRAYILGSDYFIDIVRSMTVLPFNMDMMNENADKLAPAIIGEGEEPLGTGEELTTRFFDLVDRGDWTWDVLGKLSEAIVDDVDGDGQDSINDRLGIIADAYGGLNASAFIYSCGEQLIETYTVEDENSPYYGKQWMKYADTSASLNRIYDEVKAVFTGKGSLATSEEFSGNTPDNPGAAYHHTKFAANQLLFGGVCALGTLEDEAFQSMEYLFSVVPCPKTDAEKSYNTVINNQADVGAINVKTNPRKARVLSAYIQYCTEKSPEIRHQLQEIVMKRRVTEYNQGTDRMFNIIYDGILYSRDYMVDGSTGEPYMHRLMMTNRFEVGSDYITTEYNANRATLQQNLDELIVKWYSLPGGPAPAAE